MYRHHGAPGGDVARKVFYSAGLTRLVQYVIFGAPNPYIWCERTVRAATLRRQILQQLVPFWLGNRLRVAAAVGQAWNDDELSYELHTEWIDGRPAALRQPFASLFDDEARQLHRRVMMPLQRRLIDAGFDGLAWQAGLGNPVAMNNFLLERGGGTRRRWVWIDLESGVPAVFAINPIQLLRFYLPRAWRFGGPMFDDVNIATLRRYLDEHESELRPRIGEAQVAMLHGDVDELATCQNPWRALPRAERSIRYQQSKRRIDTTQAQWYARHPWLWYTREAGRALPAATRKAWRLTRSAARWIAGVGYIGVARSVVSFLFSQRYRSGLARQYVAQRIDDWQSRGQLSDGEVTELRDHLDQEEAGSYITDFGVHLAIKPAVKAVEWGLIPALVAGGVLGQAWVPIALTCGGSVGRTLYTVGRLIQSAWSRREKPWVALITGVLPVVGNLAYPVQILYSGTDRRHELARFIIYDTFSLFGANLPIWGGRDTLTEHVFNRVPTLLLRNRAAPTAPDAPISTAPASQQS